MKSLRVHYQIISTVVNDNENIPTSWPLICLYAMKKLHFVYMICETSDIGLLTSNLLHGGLHRVPKYNGKCVTSYIQWVNSGSECSNAWLIGFCITVQLPWNGYFLYFGMCRVQIIKTCLIVVLRRHDSITHKLMDMRFTDWAIINGMLTTQLSSLSKILSWR